MSLTTPVKSSAKPSNKVKILIWTLYYVRQIGGYRKKNNLLSYFTIISIFLANLSMILDLLINWDGIQSIRKIAFLPGFIVTQAKAMFLIMDSTRIHLSVESLKIFWPSTMFGDEIQAKHDRVFKIIQIILTGYLSSGYLVCLGMVTLPLLPSAVDNELIFTDFAICDRKSLPCWSIMWTWQNCVLNLQIVPAAIAFDAIFMIFIGYTITACELLEAALERLNTDDFELRRHMMRNIIAQHDFIMQFLHNINDMYLSVMLLQFWCSLGSMILFLHMIVADGLPPKVGDVIFFGSLYTIIVFQIFIYSSGGAFLEDRIRKVPTDIFSVNWHGKGRTQLRQDLALMICRAQNTKVLNVGKMADLNLALFVATVKNALSVFTLIFQLSTSELNV